MPIGQFGWPGRPASNPRARTGDARSKGGNHRDLHQGAARSLAGTRGGRWGRCCRTERRRGSRHSATTQMAPAGCDAALPVACLGRDHTAHAALHRRGYADLRRERVHGARDAEHPAGRSDHRCRHGHPGGGAARHAGDRAGRQSAQSAHQPRVQHVAATTVLAAADIGRNILEAARFVHGSGKVPPRATAGTCPQCHADRGAGRADRHTGEGVARAGGVVCLGRPGHRRRGGERRDGCVREVTAWGEIRRGRQGA